MALSLALTVIWAVIVLTYCFLFGDSMKWGDPETMSSFLTGAFGPPALIWLAATVFLQRAELRAQRIELALNRRALESQAFELNRAADEMRRQSEAMVSLQKLKQEKEVNAAIDSLYSRLLVVIRAELASLADNIESNSDANLVRPIAHEFRTILREFDDEELTYRLHQIISKEDSPFLQLSLLFSSVSNEESECNSLETLSKIGAHCATFERNVMRLTGEVGNHINSKAFGMQAEISKLRNSLSEIRERAAKSIGSKEMTLQ